MDELLQILGIVLALLGTLMTIYKFFWKAPSETVTLVDIPDSITTRFISLFESHGVNRNQIPDFFGHNLTLQQCMLDEELSNVLSSEILKDAAKLFAVNIEWLQVASEEIYSIHEFYKAPEDCELFLKKLKSSGNELSGYFIKTTKSMVRDEYDAAIVITEEIGVVNDRVIMRLHILGGWLFSYWRSRAYITACASLALKNEIWLIGKTADSKWISQFSQGTLLPVYDFQMSNLSMSMSGGWSVDEFIERPEKYLKDVDPEIDNYGINSAVSKWLELESAGHMFIDHYNDRDDIRAAFENYAN